MKDQEKKPTNTYQQMQEHPEQFADKDIEQMLDDTDTLPDVEAEWKKFCQKHTYSSLRHTLIRTAAAILITTAFSLALYAMATRMGIMEVQAEVKEQQADTTVCDNKSTDEYRHLYDNETLSTILSDMAAHHGLNVIYRNTEAKDIRLFYRWDKTESLEQSIAGINAFERFNIEIRGDELIVK